MKKNYLFILKNILVIMISFIAFPIASKILSSKVASIPKFITDSYGESFFISHGLRLPALISLCLIVSIFLIIHFHIIKDGIHNNRLMKGLLYGCSFGIFWLFGFIEMIMFFKSEGIGYVFNGIRDLLALSILGLSAGWLLCENNKIKINRKQITLLSIPFVAVFFAIFHGAQFYLTFLPLKITVNDYKQIIWLLATGAWIGFMYYLFSPGIKFKNKYLGYSFFSFCVIGTNWLLYNAFYNILVDAPLWDVFVRSFSGCLGVFVGLIIYDGWVSRKHLN